MNRYEETHDPKNPPSSVLAPRARSAALRWFVGSLVVFFLLIGVTLLFWNAANDYSKPFTAMPEMKSANSKEGSKDPRYFRGDELPTATVQASLNPVSSATR